MKKILQTILVLGALNMSAQVGIGTVNPNPSSILDVKSSDKGVLITRVSLTDPDTLLPITGTGEESLLVYNINDTKLITKGYYYWDKQKWTRLANYNDVSTLIQNQNYTTIVKANETITTLLDVGGGNYEYTNEAGVKTTINVTSSIVNNLPQLFTNNAFLTQLTNVINNTHGIVHYDGNTFTYIDNTGTTQTINFSTIVKSNETITNVSQNTTSGVISYTNEAGTTQTANVRSSQAGNVLTIGSDGGNFIDKQTIINNQAIASLKYTNNFKELQFNDGNGNGYTIGIEPLIYNNATSIFSAVPVKNEVLRLIDFKKDLLSFSNYSFKKNNTNGISTVLTDDRKVLEINIGGIRKDDLGTYIWSKDKDLKTIIIKGEGYLNLNLNTTTSFRDSNPIYASREIKILLYNTNPTNPLVVNLYDSSQGSSESTFVLKGKKVTNLNSNWNNNISTTDNFYLKSCNSCINEIYACTLESISIDNLNFYWYITNIEKQ